jgi:hypothetical protein
MLLTRKLPGEILINNRGVGKLPLWLIRIIRYEYWPWYIFYFPLLPFAIKMMIRLRSFRFIRYVNPSIPDGGLSGESKKQILDKINDAYKPVTLFFHKNTAAQDIIELLRVSNIKFPVIAKPDVGERGSNVEKLSSENELIRYLSGPRFDFLIQEYVDYPVELGIFYIRMPGHLSGQVTSVTAKKFMSVKGDGRSTVSELMKKEERFRFQVERMQQRDGRLCSLIPEQGEEIVLEPIGNHCRGTEFINANHLISRKLDEVFDRIAVPIPGFFYGRFDIRVSSTEDLLEGKNIKILELNGVSSEPGHIYDPSYKLRNAYKDILTHWKKMEMVARINKFTI